MDIILQTGKDNPSLCLKNAKPLGKDFYARLDLCSGGFSADCDFHFEAWAKQQFVTSLAEMDRTLSGEAILKPMFEDYFLRFQLDKTGHVIVSGELIEYTSEIQKLTFSFQTDQTCLRPFYEALTQLQ